MERAHGMERALQACVACGFFGALKASMIGSTLLPFFQSKVECDVPLQPGEITGSLYCGDRQKVVVEATRVTTLATSLNQAADITTLILKASILDKFDCRDLSAAVFKIDVVEKSCWVLFYLMLHGTAWEAGIIFLCTLNKLKPFYAFEYLSYDLCEGMSQWEQMAQMTKFGNFARLGGLVGTVFAMSYMSLTLDYTAYMMVLAITPMLQVAIFTVVPRSGKRKAPDAQRKSWFAQTWQDVRTFFGADQHAAFRWTVCRELVGVLTGAVSKNIFPLVMMMHAVQPNVQVSLGLAMSFLSAPLPALGMALAKKVGAKRCVVGVLLLIFVSDVFFQLLLPHSLWGMYGNSVVPGMLRGLTGQLLYVTTMKLPHFQLECRARAESLKGLLMIALDLIVSPLAVSGLSRTLESADVTPHYYRIILLVTILNLVSLLMYLFGDLKYIDQYLDELDQEQQPEAQKKED